MNESSEPPSLAHLESRLKAAKEREAVATENDESVGQGTGMAMRMGLELVSGVAAGSLVGFALDHWFGTFPFLFVVCFFLGCAGGFLAMLRSAGIVTGGLFGPKK